MNYVVLTPYESRIMKRAQKAANAEGLFQVGDITQRGEERQQPNRAVQRLKTLGFVEQVPEVAGLPKRGLYRLTATGMTGTKEEGEQ